MRLWELTPVARPDDPTWQGRPQFDRVLVRAETAAEARVVASGLDTPESAPEFGDQHPRLKSGLMTEKLYAAQVARDDGFNVDGPPEVLATAPRDSQEYT